MACGFRTQISECRLRKFRNHSSPTIFTIFKWMFQFQLLCHIKCEPAHIFSGQSNECSFHCCNMTNQHQFKFTTEFFPTQNNPICETLSSRCQRRVFAGIPYSRAVFFIDWPLRRATRADVNASDPYDPYDPRCITIQ